jgi:hypothetical protein
MGVDPHHKGLDQTVLSRLNRRAFALNHALRAKKG